MRFLEITQHQFPSLGSHAITTNDHITNDLFSIRKYHARGILVLKVSLHRRIGTNIDLENIACIVVCDHVHFSAMTVDGRGIGDLFWRRLSDNFSAIIFANIEIGIIMKNAKELLQHVTFTPMSKDSPAIGPEGNDVAKWPEFLDCLKDNNIMAL